MEYLSGDFKIGVVVVIYKPDWKLLDVCMTSVSNQVDMLCVIDNSPVDNSSKFHDLNSKINYIWAKKNIGIAAAQNIGINYFTQKKFDFVLFSDQDSCSPNGLVDKLVDAYVCLSGIVDIACIGPMPIDRKSKLPYISEQSILDRCEYNGLHYYKMHSIISSYSLVPLRNFLIVGNMDERLFIDFVDDDWCWRASAFFNKLSIMLFDVTIEHELGVSSTFLGHRISISSPFRIFYQTRNLFWMCHKTYTPYSWKKKNILKLLIKFIYYPIFTNRRLEYLKKMLSGLYVGLFRYGLKK